MSVSGTWMQRVAQSWLVLELTDSGVAVGALTAVQFFPILLLASTGGLCADRLDKRKLLYFTQSMASLIALTLAVLVLTETVELWMVFALALFLGIVGSFDNPARHSFVMEMVGRSKLANAVALNSVLVNTARIIGPAVGGILIVTVGIGFCFLINSGTYLVFITVLAAMRGEDIQRPAPEPRERGQLRGALRYVGESPVIRSTLIMSAVIGIFSYEFEVVLPLLARFTFGGDADTFGTMFAFMGLGAVFGGLFVATRGKTPPRLVLAATYAFGIAIAATAVAPFLWMTYIALVLVGMTSTAFLTSGNSVLQLGAASQMRGRVVGLRATAIIGARPIGAPIVGWVGEHGSLFGLALPRRSRLLRGRIPECPGGSN